jgi:Uma2 family endonuclease
LLHDWLRERQRCGIDDHDEVWEGTYVVPPLANNPHQALVTFFTTVLYSAVGAPEHGEVLPGANVSDRRTGWEHNYRVPDVVAVLEGGRAEDCTTHYCGGPDFLVEIESPGDDTEEKVPFYSQIQVRELLIVHRDTRHLRLLRHDGDQLVPVRTTLFEGKRWLVSEVVPLAFRRKVARGVPLTELCRTDGVEGYWSQ